MNKEHLFLKIINETLSDNSFLGNDCAYLKDLNLLISHDTLVENVHFDMSYFTPFEIGQKALLVNISDILSGGGVPKYATVSLSGNLNEAFIKDFYKGLNEICDEYEMKIIGGDLTGGEKITVSICIFGLGLKNVSSRKCAGAGDIVYVKGMCGNSAKGLQLLLSGVRDKQNEFIKAHIKPELYKNIAYQIAQDTTAPYVMMDTSDGLYDAVSRVSSESGVGFDIDYNTIPHTVEDKNLVLFGGEDFGLFVCLKPKDAHIADGLGLSKIGTVTDTKKIILDGTELNADKSFQHFK